MIRKPAVEGKFYPSGKRNIIDLIERLEKDHRYPDFDEENIFPIGAVLPHAGHIYSGAQTLPFFRYLKARNTNPDTFIILNPNHSGLGPSISISSHSSWLTGLGELKVDTELAMLLPYPKDEMAHHYEHSAEVILPFIQYYLQGTPFKILPVSLKNFTVESVQKLAGDLKFYAEEANRKILLIASSDFTHFLSAEEGYKKDQLVVDLIMERNTPGVDQVVNEYNLSICGYGPIMTLMAYASLLDPAYETKILARGHSGEVYPSSEVVDYISMIFYSKN